MGSNRKKKHETSSISFGFRPAFQTGPKSAGGFDTQISKFWHAAKLNWDVDVPEGPTLIVHKGSARHLAEPTALPWPTINVLPGRKIH